MATGLVQHELNRKTEEMMRNKILLVLSPDFPAQDNRYMGSLFVKQQLDCLKPYFKNVIVIVPVLFSGGLLPNDRYCHNYSYDNVTVYYPRCLFIPRSVSLPLVKNSRKLTFDSRLRSVRKLIAKKSMQFDLIHAHFTWPSAYIATRLKEEYRVPVVVTIHEDSGWFGEEVRTAHQKTVSSWEMADALIRVNRKDLPLLQQYNSRIYFIPNGFSGRFRPLEKTACRTRMQVPPDKKVLFSVGDLIARKGFSTLIDALAIIVKDHPDILCYIGGQGPEEKSLRRQIRDKRLEDSVILLGFVPEDELPVWMNCADLFVFPSLEESFGIVQIESLACGKPVIAARNTGTGEIIVSDDLGILCRPGDPASLAEAITRGLGKPWDTRKILDYAKGYSMEIIVKSILRIYSLIMGNEKNHVSQ